VIDEGFIPAPDEDAVIDEASIPIPPGMEIDENLTPTLGGEVTPPDNIDGAKVINPGTIPIPNPNEGTNEAEISEEMNFPPSDEV